MRKTESAGKSASRSQAAPIRQAQEHSQALATPLSDNTSSWDPRALQLIQVNDMPKEQNLLDLHVLISNRLENKGSVGENTPRTF